MIPQSNERNLIPSVSLIFGLALIFSSCIRRVPAPPVVKDMEVTPSKEVETAPDIDAADKRKQDRVRVMIGIRVEADKVTVVSEGSFVLTDIGRGEREVWPAGKYTFLSEYGHLLVNGKAISGPAKLQPVSSRTALEYNEKLYRGTFIVKPVQTSKLTLINEIGIDDYLKGVLPREVVVSWPLESLKSQAVASRTYLVSHLGRHNSQGFDVCSDVHCQVYGGMSKEHPECNKAVDQTRGEILTVRGAPIRAYFHSNCGGTTEEVQYVWGLTAQPYLPRRKCTFGTKDPRYHWKISFSKKEILDLLSDLGEVQGKQLLRLRVKRKSPSGRAEIVTVVTDRGTYDLKGNEFRIALHPEKIRSTLWTMVTPSGNGYEFRGQGWGHGVGMCQWGARGQAEAGRTYEEILKFYYPHSRLETWSRP